jgi:hypothetical protein
MAGFTPYTYHPSDHHGQDSTHTDDATASKAGKAAAAAHTDDGQNSSVLAAKAAKAATVDNQQQSTLASKVAATR